MNVGRVPWLGPLPGGGRWLRGGEKPHFPRAVRAELWQ